MSPLGLLFVVASPAFVWSFWLEAANASGLALDHALAAAREAHRPVLLDFSADWCAACRILDRETYADPTVIAEARRFVTIRVDASRSDDATAALAKRFDVRVLPTVVFVSSRGEVLVSPRVAGAVAPAAFVRELRRVP
jgi:thiol:disulfide interchange protein DsbD